jgi:integrating conjugative element protein (TIGR03755 family)
MKPILAKTLLTLSVGMALTSVSHAAPLVPESGDTGMFYYQMGGGDTVPYPATLDTQTIPLSVNANVGLGYNCGVFNPTLSISNAINGIQNSAMNIEQSVISNATSAIYNMPMYILARANHTIYDLMTNQFFSAQTDLSASTGSCQAMQAQIGNGQNPYTDWATVAMGDDWKKHMSMAFGQSQSSYQSGMLGDSNNSDINVVKQTVAEDNGDNGVPWIHGASQSGGGNNAGGQNQPAIEVVHDAVVAGYNVLLQSNRQYDDQSAPGATPQDTYLVGIWSNPEIAATWVVNVVGDEEITTYAGGPKQSTPGVGLLSDVYQQTVTVQQDLVNLISGATPITIENLQAVASPSMVLNQAAIQAFQQLDGVSQAIYVHKLAEAIAAEQIAEQVRLAKQLLMVGESVPQIYGNKAAKTDIASAIKKLDDYRNNMTFNNGQVFGAASEVVQAVMSMTNSQANAATQIQPSNNPGAPLTDGAMPKGE